MLSALKQQILATYCKLLKRESLQNKLDWIWDSAILIAPPSEAPAPWNDMDNCSRDERLPGKPEFWIKRGDETKPVSVIRISEEADPVDLPSSAVGQGPLGFVFKVEEGYLRRYPVSYQSSDAGVGRVVVYGLRAEDLIVAEIDSNLVDGTPLYQQTDDRP